MTYTYLILITYDLKRPGQNYDGLRTMIKTAPGWWHHLESTRIIKTNEDPDIWSSRLKVYLDQNDRLLIVDIKWKKRQWRLTKQARDWLN